MEGTPLSGTLPGAPPDLVVLALPRDHDRARQRRGLLCAAADAGHRVFVCTPVREARELSVREREPRLWEVGLPDATAGVEPLAALRDECGIGRAVLLVQQPGLGDSALAARERTGWPVVYDCLDLWRERPEADGDLLTAESRLVREADLLLAAGEAILGRWQGSVRRALVLRSGGTPLPAGAVEEPELAALPRPRIGFVGELGEWIDHRLLARIARARPWFQIVLAGGPAAPALAALATLPNVHLREGSGEAERAAARLAADIVVLPFRILPSTRTADPPELYDALALGRPVVATRLPALAPWRELFYPAEDGEAFLAQLDRAVHDRDPGAAGRRRAFAAGNLWSERVRSLGAALESLFAERLQRIPAGSPGGGLVGHLEAEVRALARRALAAEKNAHAAARELARSEDRRAAAEAELAGERARTRRLEEEAEAARAREHELGDELRRTADALAAARAELDAIHASRLWRAGESYWRLRQRLGLRVDPPPSGASPGLRVDPARVPATLDPEPTPAPAPAEPAMGPEPEPEVFGEATLPAFPAVAAALVAELEREAPVADPSRHDVVCLPIIQWDLRVQRPQHLMGAYADAGHRVFWVSQRFRSEGPPFLLERRRENLWEVSLRAPEQSIYRGAPSDDFLASALASLDVLRRELGLGATAQFVQLPFWGPLALAARERFGWPVVYDCMDEHAGFATNAPEMLALEGVLVAGADLTVAASAKLAAGLAPRTARPPLLLRNAGEAERFAAVPWRSPRQPPVVGYFGAIESWFDDRLVAALAAWRPEWSFVLVGRAALPEDTPLARCPNVELVGEVPYEELPEWIASFDLCLLPFHRTPLTEATNPVKAYEILAAGKPLVSVPLPEVTRLGDLVRTAEGAEGFLAAIEGALAAESPAESERRRAFARGETWGHRFEILAPAVAGTFSRATVVVVTHDNRELNRACFESLFARTEWPHLEVIAVDNGSVDGTAELLAGLAARHPALTVLRNAENRGFAAAVNQGLAAATGELLVLLNNDTVMSRGWLTALAGHLRRDPSLGLVGASTNEIANEAKVHVGYASLDAMPEWARAFVRAHDGEREPIPMLAMFCVAMRRVDFERAGPLDEGFEVGMFEDDDYGRRIEELGLRVAVARDAFVHHEGRASFARLDAEKYRAIFERNRARFEWKWGPWRPPMPQGVAEAHRAELAVRLGRLDGEAGRTVVFLPTVAWERAAGMRLRELARAFARGGWVVLFDCTGSREDEFAGFREPEPRLLLYRGHLDALAALPSPLLWARPCNAHFAAAWDERTVVYDLACELAAAPCRPELREANHRRMLGEAAVVIGGSAAVAASLRRERDDALELADAADDAGWDAWVAAVAAALAASRQRSSG